MIHSYSLIEDSILFENVSVGRYAKIKRAIIDKNLVIPEKMVIGYDHKEDVRNGHTVTESGIVVVSKIP
jgi:ADP-glucose pyrophosphorylase